MLKNSSPSPFLHLFKHGCARARSYHASEPICRKFCSLAARHLRQQSGQIFASNCLAVDTRVLCSKLCKRDPRETRFRRISDARPLKHVMFDNPSLNIRRISDAIFGHSPSDICQISVEYPSDIRRISVGYVHNSTIPNCCKLGHVVT